MQHRPTRVEVILQIGLLFICFGAGVLIGIYAIWITKH
jgi:hypothetical protein